MNVVLGKPEVVGIDPQYSGLVVVRVPLTPGPNADWSTIFKNGPPGVSYSISRRTPTLAGGSAEFRCGENEVETYFNDAKARVEGANRYYAERVEPILRQRQEAADREEEKARTKIEEAQRRLDQLAS